MVSRAVPYTPNMPYSSCSTADGHFGAAVHPELAADDHFEAWQRSCASRPIMGLSLPCQARRRSKDHKQATSGQLVYRFNEGEGEASRSNRLQDCGANVALLLPLGHFQPGEGSG